MRITSSPGYSKGGSRGLELAALDLRRGAHCAPDKEKLEAPSADGPLMAKNTARPGESRLAFPVVLPGRALRLWKSLSRLPALGSFYLAGGSGLALHLGHRQSNDLDFFSRRSFRTELLARRLSALGPPRHLTIGEGSVECWIDSYKTQFLYYPYRLLRPLHKTMYGSLADPHDIALMKLVASAHAAASGTSLIWPVSSRSSPISPWANYWNSCNESTAE